MKNTCLICKESWTFNPARAKLSQYDLHIIQETGQLFSVCNDCDPHGECVSVHPKDLSLYLTEHDMKEKFTCALCLCGISEYVSLCDKCSSETKEWNEATDTYIMNDGRIFKFSFTSQQYELQYQYGG